MASLIKVASQYLGLVVPREWMPTYQEQDNRTTKRCELSMLQESPEALFEAL